MRRLLNWLAIVLLLPILAALLLFFLLIDDKAVVERSEVISPLSILQAKRLFAAHDPRHQRSGEIRTVPIPAPLIDEGINYLAGRYLHGRGSFNLIANGAETRLSIALPGKRFLNLRATTEIVDGKPTVTQASLGALPIPGALVEFAIVKAVSTYGFSHEWQLAAQAIQHIAVDTATNNASVTYIWQTRILDQARAVAMQEDDIKHLRVAQTSIAALLAHRAPGAKVTLADILKATLSASSSDAVNDQPIKQGRAVLLILASHLAEKDIAALVPAAKIWPRIRWGNITLAGRHDLAQHFVVSAALAAWAGEPVADAIGVYKELEDARHGSGFSFIDLAADRAGTRFGETLINKPAQLFKAMKNDLRDEQLLPTVNDLPESLHNEAFKQRFENHQSPAFKAMQQEIERRLNTLPLYR